MKQEFYVLKEEGVFYPMAFVCRVDKIGELRKEAYKLQNDEMIVKVEFVEVID